MIKDHIAGNFKPVYKGNYCMVTIKGNQVEIVPAEGGKSQMVYITDVKYILPADTIIAKLPVYNNVRCNLAVHCSVTPFVIRQPIQRPHLLERVYKPMRTLH